MEQLFQPFEVAKQQGCALVGRKPPGKSDGERFWVQQGSSRDGLHGLKMTTNPSIARALANKAHEFSSAGLANGPQFMVRHVRDALPDRRDRRLLRPFGAEIFGIEGIRSGEIQVGA